MNLKKITLIMSLCLFSSVSWSQMKPLSEIIEKLEVEDSTYIYILNRCSGLYLASAEFLPGKLREQYMLDAINAMTISRVTHSKATGLDLETSQLNNQNEIKNFKNEYTKLSDEYYLNSGERVPKMMEDDLMSCKPIVAEAIKVIPDELLIKELPRN